MQQAQQKPQTPPAGPLPQEVEKVGQSRFTLARPAAFVRNAGRDVMQDKPLPADGRLLTEIAEFLYRTTPEMLRSAPPPPAPLQALPVQHSKPEHLPPPETLDKALEEVVLTSLWRSLAKRDRATVTNLMKLMLLDHKPV